MAISVNHALKLGIVSGRAAAKWKKPSILSATTAQRSKMAQFDGKKKDEGPAKHAPSAVGKTHINVSQFQADRASSLPSKSAGRSSNWGGVARTQSKQGGRVGDDYTPGKHQIDQYPQKQREVFPRDSGYGGRGFQKGAISAKTDNSRMKGKTPIKSGGPSGGNANSPRYYGGPRGKDGT